MYRFFTVPLVAILLTFSFSPSLLAQDSPVDPDTYRGTDSEELNKYASENDLEIDDGYKVPTFKNLSKLYWALAMFDLGDDEAIDNYLLINECDLYQKYFHSDFEFDSLRTATRETIVKNMASFPVKFEILIPVGIDRYDTGTEKFKLDPRSHFIGSKRLEVSMNKVLDPVCGNDRGIISNYPKNIILSLSRPFTLTEIPVPPEVAQVYIEESENLSKTQLYRYDISKFGRVGYLRLKVTMNQFRGFVKQTGKVPVADVFGTIDGFELYGDKDKTLLLHSQEAQEIKVYRRKKVPKAVQPEPKQESSVTEQAAPIPTESSVTTQQP